MKIKYPTTINNDKDKLAYNYKLFEALRLKHNEMGDLYKKGRITKNQWAEFLGKVFEVKREIIMNDIVSLKSKIIKNLNIDVDIDKDFEE